MQHRSLIDTTRTQNCSLADRQNANSAPFFSAEEQFANNYGDDALEKKVQDSAKVSLDSQDEDEIIALTTAKITAPQLDKDTSGTKKSPRH